MKYAIPSLLFLVNDEVFSALALVIITCIFLFDIWKARPKYDAE